MAQAPTSSGAPLLRRLSEGQALPHGAPPFLIVRFACCGGALAPPCYEAISTPWSAMFVVKKSAALLPVQMAGGERMT